METKPFLFSEKCFLCNKRPFIANTMFTGRDDSAVGMHHVVWAEDNFEALFLWLIRARLGRQEPEVCNKTL